jgi:4-hydroxy-2-oxoheptanedioate aldolase
MTRATGFGDIAGYHKAARQEIAVLVQVETLEAVDDVERIATLPGIDGIFVGPADLAAALGHAGEPGHPDVKKAVVDTVRRIVAAGKPAGFLSADEAYADLVTQAGATFVARDIDMTAMKRALKSRL